MASTCYTQNISNMVFKSQERNQVATLFFAMKTTSLTRLYMAHAQSPSPVVIAKKTKKGRFTHLQLKEVRANQRPLLLVNYLVI